MTLEGKTPQEILSQYSLPLEYNFDSSPKEPLTRARTDAVIGLTGTIITSGNHELMIEGTKKLFPVLRNERSTDIHQMATNSIVSITILLHTLQPEQDISEFKQEVMRTIFFSNPSMDHTKEALQRLESVVGRLHLPGDNLTRK